MSKRHLLVATSNEGKLRELSEVLKDLPIAWSTLADYPEVEPVAETGLTFIENASIKAAGYAEQTNLLTLADDSGLEVEALLGAPGVFSARYLSETASYAERINALQRELTSTQSDNRAARFVCAIAIAGPDTTVLNVSTGVCAGTIATTPRGSGGFGYDPIFVPDGHERTFAELPGRIKNEISHRARALKGARDYLLRLTGCSRAD